MPPSSYEEFQARYESEATRELGGLSSEPLPALLRRVRQRDFGDYHTLWRAIASKATLEQAGWRLFDVLTSDAEYLVRYHCADALLQIADRKLSGMTPVMLSGGIGHGTPGHLEAVRAMLESTIGPAGVSADDDRDDAPGGAAAVDNANSPAHTSPEDLTRRRPVWEAMSAFFLDTELAAADHARIADVLRASGYSIPELDHILWHELCPALWRNTTAPAGAWSAFDMPAVEHQILTRPAGPLRRWWTYHAGGRTARHDWEIVRALLATVR